MARPSRLLHLFWLVAHPSACGDVPTSVHLTIEAGAGVPAPARLGFVVYDIHGVALRSRLPSGDSGPLPAPQGPVVGTIVITARPEQRELRIAVRGLDGADKVISEGVVRIGIGAGRQTRATVTLMAGLRPDVDRDDVADAIDNCAGPAAAPNPGQEDADGDGKGDLCSGRDGGGPADAQDASDAAQERGEDAASDAQPADGPPDSDGLDRAGSVDAGKANGSTCESGADCASGFCVDGVCCESACAGPCRSCSRSAGRCSHFPAGDDPENECADQTTAACGTDGACDGAGGCRKYGETTVCQPPACTGSASLTPARSCDGLGACRPAAGAPCDPYACRAAACLTSCSAETDCAMGFGCVGTACVRKQADGAPCTMAAACASGRCADGVCCATVCSLPCEACNLAGSAGICTPVPAGQDPSDECAGTGSCGGVCNGARACRFPGAATSCGVPSCQNGTLTASTCDGAGTCATKMTACPTMACADATACVGMDLACNDDTAGCGPGDTGSRLSVALNAGTSYYLFVDSKGGGGSFALRVTPPPTPLAGGANCAVTAAIDPRGGIYSGKLSGASSSLGCLASGEAIYRYRPAVGGTHSVRVDIGPGLSMVALRHAASCAGGTCASAVSVSANPVVAADTDWYFVIDGNANGGDYTLTVTSASQVLGDVAGGCGSPLALGAGGGRYSGASSMGGSAAAATCAASSGKESVFSFNPRVSGTWTIDTCGSAFDTVLYVRSTCP